MITSLSLFIICANAANSNEPDQVHQDIDHIREKFHQDSDFDPGHRIVDAAQIHPEERFPFLVIFNFLPVSHNKTILDLRTK